MALYFAYFEASGHPRLDNNTNDASICNYSLSGWSHLRKQPSFGLRYKRVETFHR